MKSNLYEQRRKPRNMALATTMAVMTWRRQHHHLAHISRSRNARLLYMVPAIAPPPPEYLNDDLTARLISLPEGERAATQRFFIKRRSSRPR